MPRAKDGQHNCQRPVLCKWLKIGLGTTDSATQDASPLTRCPNADRLSDVILCIEPCRAGSSAPWMILMDEWTYSYGHSVMRAYFQIFIAALLLLGPAFPPIHVSRIPPQQKVRLCV